MKKWHIPISGFNQSLAGPTGLETLWQKLRHSLRDAGGLCTDVVCLMPLVWNSPWPAVADFIRRQVSGDLADATFHVYAYSWGAGWGWRQLALEMAKRGLDIHTSVLADPVYRSDNGPVFWIRSMMNIVAAPRIKVPANVHDVWWFYQTMNKPRAHQLVAVDPEKTRIRPGVQRSKQHQWMDDDDLFHETALAVALGRPLPQGIQA